MMLLNVPHLCNAPLFAPNFWKVCDYFSFYYNLNFLSPQHYSFILELVYTDTASLSVSLLLPDPHLQCFSIVP